MYKKLAAALSAVFVGGVLAGSVVMAGTGNDRVLPESKYIEVFKKEGNGDKNYLYTITEFTDAWGRACTVVTGASETAIALVCAKREP